jgi:choice-of-anchor C domain-containing protein
MKTLYERTSSAHELSLCRTILVTTALVPIISVRTRGAHLVINGGFESPSVVGQFETYYGVDAASLTGWVVDQPGTSINHVNALWNDAEGFHSIDLNGTEASSIYQDLPTDAAQKYAIRFALAGNPFGFEDKRLEVLWDGAQVADLTFTQAGFDTINMGWTYHQFIVTAVDSSTRLTFSSLTGAMQGAEGVYAWYGPAIDDVSVAPVPEPSLSTLALASLLVPFALRGSRNVCQARRRMVVNRTDYKPRT